MTAAVPYAHTCANPPSSPASKRRQMTALPPRDWVSATMREIASFLAVYSYIFSPGISLVSFPFYLNFFTCESLFFFFFFHYLPYW